jgi:hypothetical protein
VHTSQRRPSELAALPAEIDLVLAIGLAKVPADRFQTADELVAGLAAAVAQQLPDDLRRRGELLERRGAWRPEPSRMRRG